MCGQVARQQTPEPVRDVQRGREPTLRDPRPPCPSQRDHSGPAACVGDAGPRKGPHFHPSRLTGRQDPPAWKQPTRLTSLELSPSPGPAGPGKVSGEQGWRRPRNHRSPHLAIPKPLGRPTGLTCPGSGRNPSSPNTRTPSQVQREQLRTRASGSAPATEETAVRGCGPPSQLQGGF